MLDSGGLKFMHDQNLPGPRREYCRQLVREVGSENIRQCYNHAKVIFFRAGDWRIVVDGSANIQRNLTAQIFDSSPPVEFGAAMSTPDAKAVNRRVLSSAGENGALVP